MMLNLQGATLAKFCTQLALLVAVTACSGDNEDAYAAGTLTVRGGGVYDDNRPGGCGGNLDYNRQYRSGLEVVVYSASGDILGSGTLQDGRIEERSWCVLPFRFPLSGTSDNYEISVGGERVVVQDITAVDLGVGPQ